MGRKVSPSGGLSPAFAAKLRCQDANFYPCVYGSRKAYKNNKYLGKKWSGSPLKHSPDFHGPLKSRSCTDVLCFLLFLVFIGGWVVIATLAYKTGDPERLIYPTDSLGRRCGVDDLVKDKPHLFFFDLTKCASPTVLVTGCPTPQVCVNKCPDTDFAASYYLIKKDLAGLKKHLICKYEIDVSSINSLQKAQEHIDRNECASWYIQSKPLAGRCIPSKALEAGSEMVRLVIDGEMYDANKINSDVMVNATKILAAFSSSEEVGEMLLQDLTGSWHLVLLGLVEAMVLCLFYIFIMRFLAEPMVWLSLFGSIILLSFFIYTCYERYTTLASLSMSKLPDPSLGDIFTGNFKAYLAVRETWLVMGIIAIVVLVIVLLITLALRNRLRIAIALIREASKAVGSTMSTMVFPVVPWLLQLGVLTFGVSVMVYLASSGYPVYRVNGMSSGDCVCSSPDFQDGYECSMDMFKKMCKDKSGGECLKASCSFYAYRSDTRIKWFHFYNIVGLFWGLFFISAFGEMVLAGTFASWYWTFKKENVPYFTVTNAFFRTIRYHMGTLAFGSLVITICRLIRLVLEWVDHKLKKYQDNSFARGILCCCRCCFWCLEKFLRFLNRNAYIMCAVHGKNFCNSAKDAFFLLMRNVVRVVVLDKVTDFLLGLGKLLIVCAMGAQWFYILSRRVTYFNESVPELNYYMVPVFIIVIGSYFIASVFFNVYAMAVDTLFLCFLEDNERNDGSAEKPYFMPAKLLRILSKKNKLE
ncbi:choline transporter-like 2 isoform X3 [Cloeon dipterum]|uniref:choline transporter-like 2 isoform X3 n=1 Tax=Cloeon dipterum TaxID=197152 RepID=UPI00321FC41C